MFILKKSAKALLGAAGVFTGIGFAMNGFVLTRVSKAFSEKKKEIEEKKNPTDHTLPENVLRAEGDAWVDTQNYEHIVIKNRKNKPIHGLVVKQNEPTDKWLICVHGYKLTKRNGELCFTLSRKRLQRFTPCPQRSRYE